MKTTSILLFALIFIFVIQPDFKQNSVYAQHRVCAICGADIDSGQSHASDCKYGNSGNKENSSSSNENRMSIIDRIINLITGDKNTDANEKERLLKEQQEELEKIAAENEEQRLLKEKIATDLHNKLMALYKHVPGSKELKPKKLSDYYKEKDDIELKLEKDKFKNNHEEWVKENDKNIIKRLEKTDPYISSLTDSIKARKPLPKNQGKSFDDLEPGDIILVGNEGRNPINWIDKKLSGTDKSKASHTLIYLKNIAGKKMFLDCQPVKGPLIITEDEYVKVYGHRPADVAHLLINPVKPEDGDKLYNVAFNLMSDNLEWQYNNPYNFTDGTNYGVWLGQNMVCSEADRWVLIKSGHEFPESEDFLKKYLGVNYSPADFYKSCYFFVTPLKGVK